MGLAMSWMAVEGLAPAEVYDRLKLVPTGKVGFHLDSNVAATELPQGWVLVTFRGLLNPSALGQMLEWLPDNHRIIVCHIEEHVNFSAAAAWKNGTQLWSVEHEGDTEVLTLAVTGDPPEPYGALASEARQGQQVDPEVDHLFDVPLQLAGSITGHTTRSPINDFDLLAWQQPTRRRWRLW